MNNTKKKAKVVKIAPKPSTLTVEKPQPTSVAALAYQYWVEAGYQGDDLTHWLRAEQQLNNQN
ncbi:MAG: DUF2934 domain-containing protein [Candidatus Obscuribacterales bacterium]|jgi:hypothetical protein|nr:DUF2934 domain-containing protein [Cyanobacteria bacterium SZAS LIN-5]RTL36036.1 MAG: DUF2934 domain-containing protein [Candidatus Melainabacteria bacterium]